MKKIIIKTSLKGFKHKVLKTIPLTEPRTIITMLTQDEIRIVEGIQEIILEKEVLPPLKNQDWIKIKLKTKSVNKFLKISQQNLLN